MALRLATLEDVPSLVALVSAFHLESPYSQFPFDTEKVFSLVTTFVGGEDKEKTAIVLDYGGTIIGFVFGHVNEVIFGHSRIASELAWYVVEHFRKGTNGAKLRTAFEYWATEVVKADIIHMASLDGVYAEQLDKHYKKKGYKLFEMTYLKDLSNGSSL